MFLFRSCRYSAAPLARTCRLYSTSSATVPPLPPPAEWPSIFDTIRDRAYLKLPETAQKVANSFLGDKSPVRGEGKVIIETFPGPGALSRALLQLPPSKVRKLIIVEEHPDYLEYLKPLEQADPRVHVIPLSGFVWETYTHLEDAGLLADIQTVPWEAGLHPHLHFISHLQRSIQGEQLIAQLFRCIPDRTWLYKYGRVPMSFVMSEWVSSRIAAGPGSIQRCKLSVIADATAECRHSLEPRELQPYEEHFHPLPPRFPGKKPAVRQVGHPFLAMNIIPHPDQFIEKGMLEKWDFCLRRLFVLKSTPLKRALNSLAPGATSLVKILTDPSLPEDQRMDVNKPPRLMTVADWALLVRAFDAWPFAPDDLLIYDAFSRQNAQRTVL